MKWVGGFIWLCFSLSGIFPRGSCTGNGIVWRFGRSVGWDGMEGGSMVLFIVARYESCLVLCVLFCFVLEWDGMGKGWT